MPLTDPGTRSPGNLFLAYTLNAIQHKVKVRYITGVDMEDVSAARGDADAFAAVFKACLSNSESIGGWGLSDPAGLELYSEPFSPVIVGTIGASAVSNSHTITLSGLGVPTGVGGAKGKTRVMIFEGGVINSAMGVKTSLVAAHAGLTGLQAWLHSNLRCFADYYGQHAEPKTYVTHQWNARAQRIHGA